MSGGIKFAKREVGDIIAPPADVLKLFTDTEGTFSVMDSEGAVTPLAGGGGDMLAANNLSELTDAAEARANLGVNKRIVEISLLGTALAASEVLAAIMPPTGETWTFPANLSTSSGKKLSGGVNPAGSYTIDVSKNGSTVGTITISAAGAVSFTTSGGTSFSLTGGTDELRLVGHATPDTAVGYVFALVATWA